MIRLARPLMLGFAASLLAGCQPPPEQRPAKRIEQVNRPAPGTARMPASESGWELVWADEFDKPAIDRAKWDFDVDCWGGGNNERQCYTDRPDNAQIMDGRLVITARKEAASWWSEHASDPLAPFDQPFHLILNLAIGGGLAEQRGSRGLDESGFPKTLEVDWVRVWQSVPATSQGSTCKR
jgi:beta-glucanase (GH16 family)